MKRTVWFLLSAVFVVLLFMACPGGSGPGPEGEDAGDGGNQPGQDGGPGKDGGSTGNDGGSTGNDGGSTGNDGGSTGNDGGSGITPAITATNQTLGLTTLVTVGSVTSDGPGWVVIYSDNGSGGLGSVIGHTAVPNGSSSAVTVGLERRATDGETLHAVLHQDLGTQGTFEVPGADTATNAAAAFTVTIPAGTADIRITTGNQSLNGYVFSATAVSPSIYQSQIVGSGTINQPLTLKTGWRYTFFVQNAGVHPIAFTTADANSNPANDVILLSQKSGVTGSFEGDSTVNWAEDATAKTATFTVSSSIASALTGYRCDVHVSTMRGSITVQ